MERGGGGYLPHSPLSSKKVTWKEPVDQASSLTFALTRICLSCYNRAVNLM